VIPSPSLAVPFTRSTSATPHPARTMFRAIAKYELETRRWMAIPRSAHRPSNRRSIA
jgi:hypothetical protein